MKKNQLATTTATMSPETALSLSIVVTRMSRQKDAERRAQAQRNADAANDYQGMVTMVGGIASEQEQRLAQLQGTLLQSESISRAEHQMLTARIRELEEEALHRDKAYQTVVKERRDTELALQQLQTSSQATFFQKKSPDPLSNTHLVVATDVSYAQKLQNSPLLWALPGAAKKTLVFDNCNIEITNWRSTPGDLYLTCAWHGNYQVYIPNMDINSPYLSSTIGALILAHKGVNSRVSVGVTPTVCIVSSSDLLKAISTPVIASSCSFKLC